MTKKLGELLTSPGVNAAAVMRLISVLARAHQTISGSSELLRHASAYTGGGLTMVVGGDRGAVAKTTETDFAHRFGALRQVKLLFEERLSGTRV